MSNDFDRGAIREVRIADCVHFCGFRYGHAELNPYENYIVGLAKGEPRAQLRQQFEQFLQTFRPKDLGEALGVATGASVPLWLLPWKSWRKLRQPRGWQDSPLDVVDIITHFSPQGIRRSQIEQEYGWLEGAWSNIRDHGYLPEKHSYISVFELQAPESSRYIVVDGNHRTSAAVATGLTRVKVRRGVFSVARRQNARFWPLVLSGHVSLADALAIFDAYFDGPRARPISAPPASIIESL